MKPANVLMVTYGGTDDRPRAKLADFGIASLTGTVAVDDGVTVGTAAYLSPEQAMREPIEAASDVYSLGLALLECFTRSPEFPGTQLESATARLIRDPLIPETLSPQWAALLTAMTTRVPSERPTSAQAVAALGELIGIERALENRTDAVQSTLSELAFTDDDAEVFNRIARVASRLLNASIVIVAAIENDEARVLSHHGVDAHLVDPVALLANPHDGVSPLTLGNDYIERVSGSLVRGADGRTLGSLWVLDERAHTMSAYDDQNLADIVALVEREFAGSTAERV